MTYDREADALYLELVAPIGAGAAAASEEVAPNVVLDFDAAGQVIGVEILGVSARPGLDPFELALQIRGVRDAGAEAA